MKWLNSKRLRIFIVVILAAMVVGGSAKADFIFGQRVNLGPGVNSPYGDYSPFITSDGLSLYFDSTRPGGPGDDIWVTTRATISDPWELPVNLGVPVNSEYSDWCPSITADELILVFSSDKPGGLGGFDIWMTNRPTKESPWDPPVNLGSPVNSEGEENCPCISADGCKLYFSTLGYPSPNNPDIWFGGDIYLTTRPTRESPWDAPVKLEIMPSRNGSGNWGPSISANGLAFFFESDYADVSLFPDIWLTTRTRNDSEWGTPILLGAEINTRDGEMTPSISTNGSTLYWCSGPGSDFEKWDLWQSTITPIVDFNGDGNIDTSDMVMLIDGWGTNDTLYDIGPMPWGDGVVDIEDLKIFMKYWEQENMP